MNKVSSIATRISDEEKEMKKGERKDRSEEVKREDRNKVYKVYNGKGYVKRELVNPRYVGLKWGERVKTRKPCTHGANKERNRKIKRKTNKK